MYRPIIFALTGFLIFGFGHGTDELDPYSDDFVNDINTKQDYWSAERIFHKDTPLSSLKRLMGTFESIWELTPLNYTHPIHLPDTFDARKHWPNCKTIGDIRDQGACGSCWAVGPVEVMTDRVCIHSKGAKHFYFTAEHLVSCSWECGSGCSGGYADMVWHYWEYIGIVSGGPYGSKLGCLPYRVAPCEHLGVKGPRKPCIDVKTPTCVNKCIDGYNVSYAGDMQRGKSVYSIPNNVDQIRQEIYTNGPVAATFTTFEDFLYYRAGVYKYVSGKNLGRHTVKIIGWGLENSKIPYWLVANSWNTDWGINGFFKILRGKDECGIESRISAGLPA